jgi:diadenosine tetraphosphatase ApaH/serine/threonine PP2A family protein phosphatase
VRLAIFADIHANRQAFAACLEAARERDVDRLILLGDFVGYGGDPEWTVDTVMSLVGEGAIAVRGNHDHAIAHPSESMNPAAQAAIDWTRGRLSAVQRKFLAELPLTEQEDDRLYVHSEGSNPLRWRYVQSAADAARSMTATAAQITFCGHIHLPSLYSISVTAKMTSFVPTSGIAVQLLKGRQWLAVAGSVGQPRDHNPAACFLTFDTDSREVTYCRVAYDVELAAKRIRDAGLPHWLADRLTQGR